MKISKTLNADTRTGNDVTKEDLKKDTLAHIQHVQLAGQFLIDLLKKQLEEHDHTKINFLDDFHRDFMSVRDGANFKDGEWWKIHLEERHHLNDRTPKDVTLLDVLEMIADCAMAGMARSGEVYPFQIAPETLELATQNTLKLLIANTEIEKT